MGLEPGPALIGKDEFYHVFKFVFAAPNMIPAPPFPIQSLPISEPEEPQARAASDVVYEICEESTFLRWMIEPQSVWMQRLLVVAAFAGPKAAAVVSELKVRRAQPVRPKAQPSDEPAKPAASVPDGETPFVDPYAVPSAS